MNARHFWLSLVLFLSPLSTWTRGDDGVGQILKRGHSASISRESFPDELRSEERLDRVGSASERAVSTQLNAQPAASHRFVKTEKTTRDLNSDLGGSVVTVISSLAVVLGLFAGLMWITRKFGSGSMNAGPIPQEIMRPLGTTSLDARTRVTLLRCGNRILVIAQNQTGIHPLSEITDADEVLELTAACLSDSKKAFASTLRSIEREKPRSGFVDNPGSQETQQPPRRLFASA